MRSEERGKEVRAHKGAADAVGTPTSTGAGGLMRTGAKRVLEWAKTWLRDICVVD